jgi:hypothetical protein
VQRDDATHPGAEEDVARSPSPNASDSPGPGMQSGMGLRVAGFLLTAAGALAVGAGPMMIWVTVGLREIGVESASPGLDLTEGKVVLALAVVMLIAVLVARVGTSGARTIAAVIVLLAGIGAVATAGTFMFTAPSRFEAIAIDDVAERFSQATGVPFETAREQLTATSDTLGAYTETGPGVYVTLAGGGVGFIGGIVTLAWATRHTRGDAVENRDSRRAPESDPGP